MDPQGIPATKPLPLFLLWKGILKFVIDNPRYRYLIGPVSISNSFRSSPNRLLLITLTATTLIMSWRNM
jgi:hypothetical protein